MNKIIKSIRLFQQIYKFYKKHYSIIELTQNTNDID